MPTRTDVVRSNRHVSQEAALRRMQARGLWNGSFNGRESTLQQLAPYVGKLKSGIRANLDGLQEAQAIAAVIGQGVDEHNFEQPLEFEYREYKVREGSRRSMDLFAKCPDVVAEPTVVTISSSDSIGVPIRGTCNLIPVAGSNYARGSVVVQGRKLQSKSEITAEVNGRVAAATVKVVQQPPDTGAPIEIKIVPEDFGNFRARWAVHEGKPNVLQVSARHRSISRYLGPEPDFQGQNSPLFRLLLSEIIAESVCRKLLELECKERSADFRFADLSDDAVIADTVFAQLHRRMRDFVADAHSTMLSDAEVRAALG